MIKIDFASCYRTMSGVSRGSLTDYQELYDEMSQGNPVYVEYHSTHTYDKRRNGAIGRVKSINHASTTRPNRVYFDLNIEFDGRRSTIRANQFDVLWLKGYTGPTNYVFNQSTTKAVTDVNDRLGRKLAVGDFICYILYHYQVSGAGTYFGKITKITANGKVFAKNMAMKTGEPTDEKEIKDPSQIILMTKDLMDQLTLLKLSTP